MPRTSAQTRPKPRTRTSPGTLPISALDALVTRALEEDLGTGDVTASTVPADRFAVAHLEAREAGVLAGRDVFRRCFELVDAKARVTFTRTDGEDVAEDETVATVEGPARSLLAAERTALNYIQRLSGIATLTARMVAMAGNARVLDTRKTTPGLRLLEKHAVCCGGGENHRSGLYDEAMVKDNHLDLAGRPLREVLIDLRQSLGEGVPIHAEARNEAEALDAIRGGANVVLLDNLGVEEMERLCPLMRECAQEESRMIEIEASGGIGEANIKAVAACGVDRISIGALTHSAPSLDFSLRMEPIAGGGAR